MLDKICNNSAEVAGCPSLFQNGRSLTIPTDKVDLSSFKPIINGDMPSGENVFQTYADSVFIEQGNWFMDRYDISNYQNLSDGETIKRILKHHSYKESEFFFSDRLKVFWDIPEWRRYIMENGFNFSMGTKIHGTVMSLLSGVPSVLCAVDSRTREMAEYYDIPFIFPAKYKKKKLFDLYSEVDYTKFNRNYPAKFDAFHDFLKRHKLVKSINEDNIFWDKEPPIPNEMLDEKIKELRMHRGKIRYQLAKVKCEQYLKKAAKWMLGR